MSSWYRIIPQYFFTNRLVHLPTPHGHSTNSIKNATIYETWVLLPKAFSACGKSKFSIPLVPAMSSPVLPGIGPSLLLISGLRGSLLRPWIICPPGQWIPHHLCRMNIRCQWTWFTYLPSQCDNFLKLCPFFFFFFRVFTPVCLALVPISFHSMAHLGLNLAVRLGPNQPPSLDQHLT